MSLLLLQRDFQRHLTGVGDGIETWLGETAPGLAVYHNAYRAQLIDCLAETYSQTHAWLGGEAFLSAMREHIVATSPSGWTLGVYGAGFADTLARSYPNDPEAAELASLEWLLSRAFEVENAEPLPASAIAAIDWDHAVLDFVPSVAMVSATTNAGAIWSALTAGDAPPAAAMLPDAGAMLVWRQGFSPCFRTVEPVEHQAILLAMRGGSFANLCATLVEAHGEAQGLAVAGQLLAQWFADGLICNVISEEIPCA